MVKVGMDTDSPGNVSRSYCKLPNIIHIYTPPPEKHAGYDANPIYNVTGFSQLHDTGTGGVSTFRCLYVVSFKNQIHDKAIPLSNFKIFPFANCSSFEKCPTSIEGRKLLRNILPDGSGSFFLVPRLTGGDDY